VNYHLKMHLSNRFYGHAHILARYCGLTEDVPMTGILQHGWGAQACIAPCHMKLPWSHFVWSRRNLKQAEHYELAGNVVAVGSPYLYMLQEDAVSFAPKPSKGEKSLLAFPFHGWEEQAVSEVHFSTYLDSLLQLRKDGFDPITVCLYWLEYENPSIRSLYENNGMAVITNGRRDDNPDFLYKQFKVIQEHACVTSNRVASCTFYALASRRPYFSFGLCPGLSATVDASGKEYAAWQEQNFSTFSYDKFDGSCQVERAMEELGADCMMSPSDLKETLGWNDRLPFKIWLMKVQRFIYYRKLYYC